MSAVVLYLMSKPPAPEPIIVELTAPEMWLIERLSQLGVHKADALDAVLLAREVPL